MELYLPVCLLLLLVPGIHGGENIPDVTEKLNDMNTTLQEVRGVVGHLEQRLDTDFNFAIKNNLKTHLELALEDILRTRSIDSLINSHVMNSLHRLKKAHHVLKNSFRFYVERFGDVERENRNTKAELAKVKDSLEDIRHVNEFQTAEILNLKLKLNETRAMCMLGKQDDSGMAAVRNTTKSVLVSTTVSSVNHLQYNVSRVLYLSTNRKAVPKQLSLKNHHLQTFPFQISNVSFLSVVFEPTLRKLIFSLHDNNHKIILCSSNLEGGAVKVIKYGIQSYGLAVDTIRSVIFMTTVEPTPTISRMRPDGSDFRVVADMNKYVSSFDIAVAPAKQLIYTSHWDAVIETSYDGSVRRTIATGNGMYALDYDNISHKLYYSNENQIKRWSPGTTESFTVIDKLPYTPSDLKFYRNSLYIAYAGISELGIIYLNKEGATYRKLPGGQTPSVKLCLIP